jgi:RNA polymerase sigma factor (TIGR02999 family)
MKSEPGSLDILFSVMYERLRELASRVRRNGASETLNPTALVNEAYLKLAGTFDQTPESALHFRRVAARAMRQILVDAARRRSAAKRVDRGSCVRFDEDLLAGPCESDAVVLLDGALDDLARQHPRMAAVVEYRFFGGYTLPETAEILGVSEATAQRDWRAARAWLALHLRRSEAA